VKVLHVGLESPAVRARWAHSLLVQLREAQREGGTESAVVWSAETATVDEFAITPGASWWRRQRQVARAIRRARADVIDVHFAALALWAVLSGALRSATVGRSLSRTVGGRESGQR
jgi:hypothetical protein